MATIICQALPHIITDNDAYELCSGMVYICIYIDTNNYHHSPIKISWNPCESSNPI